VLEALGRLGRGPEGTPLVTVLRQYAPSWLVHLPALLAPEDRERLEHTTSGVTPARMLRELAEALEVLTAARPLVLVLEDLHWSDRATLEWLAYVVRRRDPARLLILGTYRPAELMVHAQALRAIVAELRHHPQYAELGLDALSAAATAAYLRQRCGAQAVPTGLPQLVHQRTGGNPLFLVAMADALERQGLLERAADASGSLGALAALRALIPRSLRQYIEQHLAQLSEADQALLEAASVAGSTFAVAAVAAGVAQAPATLEGRLTAFARQGRFIQAAGTETWPDGTLTACYQFRHALYHEVVYARVSAGHRVRLHQQIGVRKETGYGAQARQIAAELALHFTRGRETGRAVTYLQSAGDNALRRSAYQEAIPHLTGGLALLATLPETPERAQQELAMQTTLGPALVATKGFAAPEVWHAYTRARALCQQVGDPLQRFQVLRGLWYVALIRLELRTARELGEQLLTLAQQADDAVLRVEAHYALGLTMNYRGALAAAQTHLAQGIALYDPQQHRTHAVRYGQDAGVACRAYGALTLWWLGYPERALRQSAEAVALAQELAHPFSVGFACVFAAWLHQLRREGPQTHAWAEAARALVAEHQFAALHAQGTIYRGWAVAAQGAQPGVGQAQGQEGLAQIQQGLAAWRATGAEGVRPYYLALQAEVAAQVGQPEAALTLLAEALAVANDTEERRWEAELYRLTGEVLLTLAANKHAEAETCLRQALAIARGQQAKALELRAAMSLSRLWQQQGKRVEAYDLLAPVYGWFTEGFDTADLQEAQALLDALTA
jgi:predicted ATPase